MTAPAKTDSQPSATPRRAGIPDDELSPEELEELEAFRRMAKISREATREWMKELIKPAE